LHIDVKLLNGSWSPINCAKNIAGPLMVVIASPQPSPLEREF